MAEDKRKSRRSLGERAKSYKKNKKQKLESAKKNVKNKLTSARESVGNAARSAGNAAGNAAKSAKDAATSTAETVAFGRFFNATNPFAEKVSKLLKQLDGMKHWHAKTLAIQSFFKAGEKRKTDRKGVMLMLYVLMAEQLHVKIAGFVDKEDDKGKKSKDEPSNDAIRDTARLFFNSSKYVVEMSFAELTKEEEFDISAIKRDSSKKLLEKESSRSGRAKLRGKSKKEALDDNYGIILTEKTFGSYIDYVFKVIDSHPNEMGRIITRFLKQTSDGVLTAATTIAIISLLARDNNTAGVYLDTKSGGVGELFTELEAPIQQLELAKKEGFDDDKQLVKLTGEVQAVLNKFKQYSMTLSFKKINQVELSKGQPRLRRS